MNTVSVKIKTKGQNQNIKTENISFEMVEQFKYFGTILINEKCI
jgi:hypothetical protein